jgi:hypothetical protein
LFHSYLIITPPLLAARYLPHTVTYPLRYLLSLLHQPIAVTMPSEFTMINIKPLPEGDCLKGKDNWPAWHMQMKAMLRQMQALGHADGTDKRPESTKAEDGNQEDFNTWDEVYAEALCLVQLCIAPTLLWRIQGCSTLFQAWKKLYQAYQPTNRASRVHYMRQLLRLQLQKSGNVQEHVSEFLQLFDCLGTLSITFSNKVRASYLLALLPEFWDTFVTALEAREHALSIDVAVDLLFEEADCRLICRASDMAAQSALAAQASQALSKPFKSRGNWAREQTAKGIPPSRPCSTCGEMHWNFQCKSAAPAVAATTTAVPAAAKVAGTLPLLSQLDLGTHGYAWMASSAFKGFSGWYFHSCVGI